MSLDCSVVRTRSGARAMLDRTSGELMHPGVGPLVEPERLYLAPSRLSDRLLEPGPRPLVLFDVGLGAGSNAAAAWRLSESIGGPRRPLCIISFDRSLAALELALSPEHAADFALEGDVGRAARQVCAQGVVRAAHTEWRFVEGRLPSALDAGHGARADVIYWDPFSPRKNPELWSCAAFEMLRSVCEPGATLHTYSGATAVRSALLLAGFATGLGPLISAGRYGTQAALGGILPHPLDRRWLERLARSSAPLPPDAPEDALARIAKMPQFSA